MNGPGAGGRSTAWPAAAFCLLLAGFSLATEWVRLPVPDVSWLLYIAGRMAGGAAYGVDVVDVAPPPIIWYSIPAVKLGEWSGLGPWRGFLVVLGLTGLAMLYLVRRIGGLNPAWDATHRRVLLGASALAIYVLPWGIFGEREHVALMLVLPYVVLFAAREAAARVPAGLAIATGLAAGLGFAIKPHYALPWAALALVALWRHGPTALARRAEFVCASLSAAGAVLAVLVMEPGYVEYMRRFGALYLEYVPQNPVFVALFGESNSAIVVLIAVLATMVLWRSLPARARPTALYLLVAAISFHLIAALQMKGWRYHYLPGLCFSFILLLLLWAEVRPPVPRLAGRAYRAAALGTVVALLGKAVLGNVGRLTGAESATFDPNFERLLTVAQRYGGERPIAVLSANLASAFPLAAEAGTGWALRYGGLPWLAAFYRDEVLAGRLVRPRAFDARPQVERWFGESVTADLRRYSPGLIIVPTPRDGGGAGFTRLFDYLGYFEAVPGFRELLADYQPIGHVGAYAVLQHRTLTDEKAAPFTEPPYIPLKRQLPAGTERAALGVLVGAVLLITGYRERRRDASAIAQ